MRHANATGRRSRNAGRRSCEASWDSRPTDPSSTDGRVWTTPPSFHNTHDLWTIERRGGRDGKANIGEPVVLMERARQPH